MLKLPRVTRLLRGGAGCQQLCLLLSHIFHHPQPRGRPVFSPLTRHGPSPGPPASQALTLLKRYPHASIACEPHPRSPTSPKTHSHTQILILTPHTHSHTHKHAIYTLIPGRGWPPGKRPPGTLNSSGGRSPEPCPCLSASPSFLIFPSTVSHPAPCTSA